MKWCTKDNFMKYLLIVNFIIFGSMQAGNTHVPIKETHQPPAPQTSSTPDTNPPPTKRRKIEIDPELEQKIAAKREKWQKQQNIFTATEEVATASSVAKVPLMVTKPALSAMKHVPAITAVGGALTLAGAGLTAAAGIAISEGKQALEHLDPAQEAQFVPVDTDTPQNQPSSAQTQDVETEEIP